MRRVAHEYLNEAEDYGYSPDICGYVKADVAVQLRHGAHPMGTVPKPSLAVVTNACNTYIKWAEIWERLYHIPVFTLDVPGTRRAGGQTWPGDPDFDADRAYVAGQIQELIALCEQVSGKKFDIDRLREVAGSRQRDEPRPGSACSNSTRACPAVFSALTEGTVYLGRGQRLSRHARRARAYFRDLVEEMEYKAARGLGTLRRGEVPARRSSACPAIPIFRRFNEMFAEWGGVFVNSTYLWFASGGAEPRLPVRPRAPAREPRRRRAHQRAARDGQHVPSGPRARRDARAVLGSTASSITRSRAAGRCRPGWPTAGAR